jgi:hypothetical protein
MVMRSIVEMRKDGRFLCCIQTNHQLAELQTLGAVLLPAYGVSSKSNEESKTRVAGDSAVDLGASGTCFSAAESRAAIENAAACAARDRQPRHVGAADCAVTARPAYAP